MFTHRFGSDCESRPHSPFNFRFHLARNQCPSYLHRQFSSDLLKSKMRNSKTEVNKILKKFLLTPSCMQTSFNSLIFCTSSSSNSRFRFRNRLYNSASRNLSSSDRSIKRKIFSRLKKPNFERVYIPALHVLGIECTLCDETDDPKSDDDVPLSAPFRIAWLKDEAAVPIMGMP